MKTAEGFKVKDEKELKKDIEEYAKKTGIKVNPDNNKVEIVMKGLLKNREKHGEVYCPCRLVTGNKEKDKEIICPCVFHRGEIELEGKCRCLLFFEKK
jgi:ferredoxin-thioredoxin reductase catalytic chain